MLQLLVLLYVKTKCADCNSSCAKTVCSSDDREQGSVEASSTCVSPALPFGAKAKAAVENTSNAGRNGTVHNASHLFQ